MRITDGFGRDTIPTQSTTPPTVDVFGGPIDWGAAQDQVPGDAAQFRQFVELFRDESQTHLTSIAHALQQRNYSELRRAAHTLKSAADLFRAEPLLQKALALEEAALHKATPTLLDQAFLEVEREHHRLDIEITRFLSMPRNAQRKAP